MAKLLVFLGMLALCGHFAAAEYVQSIRTQTRSCLTCGMTAGELSVKVHLEFYPQTKHVVKANIVYRFAGTLTAASPITWTTIT